MRLEEFAELIKKEDFPAYIMIFSLHMIRLLKNNELLIIFLLY